MLLVGARAALHWFGERARPTQCWDVWASADEVGRWRESVGAVLVGEHALPGGRTHLRLRVGDALVEAVLVPDGGSEQAFIRCQAQAPESGTGPWPQAHVASPEALALIKRSHLYDPEQWHKHIDDYHFLVARIDPGTISTGLRAAGELRRREWREQHPEDRGSGSMRIPNDAFFANTRMALIRAYEHDGLHQATCYGMRPLYQRLKDDAAQAYVSGRHFEAMSHLDRVRLVREESYAIALERVVIPAMELGLPWDADLAFRHALRRICTNLTTGWFRDFAIENYPEICRYDVDFVARFRAALARGSLARLPVVEGPKPWRERLRDHLAEIVGLDARAALV